MNQDILDILVIDIEKAKKGAEIGTIKEYNVGGKKVKYIKTAKGWRPYSQKKAAQGEQQKQEENTTKEQPSTSQSAAGAPSEDTVKTLTKYTKEADTENLKKFINNPNSPKWIVEIAKKELENRGENAESSSKESNAQEKKEIFSKQENTANTSSNDGFKKITQTYVKVDGNTIVLNMKGDDKYKAKKGSFYMESEPNESLVKKKKKVKEAAEKHFSDKQVNNDKSAKESDNSNSVEKKGKDSNSTKQQEVHFNDIDDVYKFITNRNKIEKSSEVYKNFKNYIAQYELKETDFRKANDLIKEYKEGYEEAGEVLDRVYSYSFFSESKNNRLKYNSLLVKNGFTPIADETLLDEGQAKDYKSHTFIEESKARSLYIKEQKKIATGLNDREHFALACYTGNGYSHIREYNYGEKSGNDTYNGLKLSDFDKALKNIIDKNPLQENLILTRRMRFDSSSPNRLNTYLTAEVGTIIEDKSFQSFGTQAQLHFGNDFQITLLAKKGDKVANACNPSELEYIVQKNTKFKVVKKGFNSIMVEIIN